MVKVHQVVVALQLMTHLELVAQVEAQVEDKVLVVTLVAKLTEQ